MPADPRAAYSFRHPESGEWAHALHADPIAEAYASYVGPVWDLLAPRIHEHPDGPSGRRPWKAVVIGFGRGFEAVALARSLATEAPDSAWEVHGLEPYPDRLEPWPERWSGLRNGEAPWWGHTLGEWSLGSERQRLCVTAERVCAWSAAAPAAACDGFLLDLFSPGKHPADWDSGWASDLARVAAPGAVLAGYSCARTVRDALREAGWQVEVIRRAGRRDSLRALWTGGGPS